MSQAAKEPFSPRVLYVAYWGAAEPLGHSLLIPSVRRLARLGISLTLVTFEKPCDWERREDIAGIRGQLEANGVEWIPCLYHKRPKVPATVFDVGRGIVQGLLARGQGAFDIVHARTFVGGLMGLVLAPALRAELVYHNEGFYPDEQVDAGVWRNGSLPHRVAKWFERRLYERAGGIIAMSHRGQRTIEQLPRVRRRGTPVVVVPSCVDLEAFPAPPVRRDRSGPLRFVYIGSVGARYRLDALGRFVAVALRRLGRVELRVCTREDPKRVAAILEAAGLPANSFSIASLEHDQIPAEIVRHDVGLLFYAPGSSAFGGSPTKVGEYWACGLPVACTADAGDVDEIVRRERVGAIVAGDGDEHFEEALQRILAVLEDTQLSARCRAAAERHYDLATGCDRQIDLYRRILRGRVEAISPVSSNLSRPVNPS